MIEIIDNFLSDQEYSLVLKKCFNANYSFGEVDKKGCIPTGVIASIEQTDEIYRLFSEKIFDTFRRDLSGLNIQRMYINLFAPREMPYFHIDNDTGFTFLFYSSIEWNIDEGGETQFIINDEIKGIFPIPNRLVKFDASILHKATSFRTFPRFTIAIKYS